MSFVCLRRPTRRTGSRRYSVLLFAALLAGTFGCGPAEVDRPGDGGIDPADTGTGPKDPPEAPYISPIPVRIPYPVITIRGGATASERVILTQEGKNPIAQILGTDGQFCFDMPADEPGEYTYSLEAHANGLTSETRSVVKVTVDPSAPVTSEIEALRTCTGADPEGCRSQVEDCDRVGDEDCNGLADAADPVCGSGCEIDYLEPNDTRVSVPGYEPDVYDGLTLCPSEVDYFGVNLDAGDAVNVRILFSDTEGNLDLELYAPGDSGEALIAATSTTDDESVFFRAASAGRYVIRVFGRTSLDTAGYSLRISVTQ